MLLLLLGCVTPPPADTAGRTAERAVAGACPSGRAGGQGSVGVHSEEAVGRLVSLVRPGLLPLDLTLVVDRSGSMAEEGRMTLVKAAINRAAAGLRPGDRLNLVAFDNEPCVPLTDFVAGRDDLAVLHDAVARLAPRGSTDIGAGLHAGYVAATRASWLGGRERDRRLVLITDALLAEKDLLPGSLHEVRRAWELHHVALSAVGVGTDRESPVLVSLVELGGGDYLHVPSAPGVN